MDKGEIVGGIIDTILLCGFLVWVAILGNNATKEAQTRNDTMLNLIIENERLKTIQELEERN